MPLAKRSSSVPNPGIARSRICHISDGEPAMRPDLLAVEEPLEIRLIQAAAGPPDEPVVAVTMRTPGYDRELAVGFLFSEGILTTREQVRAVHACPNGKRIRVHIQPGVNVDLSRLDRHSFVSSSCGVCGKTSAESIRVEPHARLSMDTPIIDPAVIRRLPSVLRGAQIMFEQTGGLHASALFDIRGNLQGLWEDVGRHNALDKLIGNAFLGGSLPLSDGVLLVSGRVSFELVQKAVVAGIRVLAAIGAPSSLAVDVAREQGLTLIGFVRSDGFNVYTGGKRIGANGVGASDDRWPVIRMNTSY